MATYELTGPIIPRKKRNSKKIEWTPDMEQIIIDEFPVTYNKVLAQKLGVSWRSLVRKAREMGINKEEGFLDKRRDEITAMGIEAHPPHPHKGDKGWNIPNSEYTRFKTGQPSLMKSNRELVEKVRTRRNETIARDRRRLRLGLRPLTKLKLKI